MTSPTTDDLPLVWFDKGQAYAARGVFVHDKDLRSFATLLGRAQHVCALCPDFSVSSSTRCVDCPYLGVYVEPALYAPLLMYANTRRNDA